jgi:hypothetical protein
MHIYVNKSKETRDNCAYCTKSLAEFVIDCPYRKKLRVLYTITDWKNSNIHIDDDAPMHRLAMRNRFRRFSFHHSQAWRHDASMIHFVLKGSIA